MTNYAQMKRAQDVKDAIRHMSPVEIAAAAQDKSLPEWARKLYAEAAPKSEPLFNVLAVAPSGKRWWLLNTGLPAEISENRVNATVYTRDRARAAADTFNGVRVNEGWALQLVHAESDETDEVLSGKVLVGTIDCTPNWISMGQAYALALEAGTDTGKAMARQGIRDMAKMADAGVEAVKLLRELHAQPRTRGLEPRVVAFLARVKV